MNFHVHFWQGCVNFSQLNSTQLYCDTFAAEQLNSWIAKYNSLPNFSIEDHSIYQNILWINNFFRGSFSVSFGEGLHCPSAFSLYERLRSMDASTRRVYCIPVWPTLSCQHNSSLSLSLSLAYILNTKHVYCLLLTNNKTRREFLTDCDFICCWPALHVSIYWIKPSINSKYIVWGISRPRALPTCMSREKCKISRRIFFGKNDRFYRNLAEDLYSCVIVTKKRLNSIYLCTAFSYPAKLVPHFPVLQFESTHLKR